MRCTAWHDSSPLCNENLLTEITNMATLTDDMIAKHKMYLLYQLRKSVTRVVKYLCEEQVLLPRDAEKILSQAADTMKAHHLLDKLKEMGQQSLDYLYAATLFAQLWPAADVLNPKNRPHKAEDKIKIPDTWPSDEHYQSLLEGTLTVQPVEDKKTKMRDYFDNPAKFNVYEMNQEIKGRALILNNYKFDRLSKRDGTLEDQRGLEIVLTALGFDVKVEQDLKAEIMKKMLEAECQIDHSKYNCFILVILSHGHEGIIYGKDGYHEDGQSHKYVDIDWIINAFSKVESLAQKPKLLILQACRGAGRETQVSEESGHNKQEMEVEYDVETVTEKKDAQAQRDGERRHDSPSTFTNQPQENMSVSNTINPATSGPKELEHSIPDTSQVDENKEDAGSSEEKEVEQQEAKTSNPFDNVGGKPLHFLIARPTTEGKLSWRSMQKGTWFIQAFIYTLANYACGEELYQMMNTVNELVRKSGNIYESEVPEFESTLIKRLFFFPGMEKKA